MNKEEFEKLKEGIGETGGCIICGRVSEHGVIGLKGGRVNTDHYCKKHYFSEVKNVRGSSSKIQRRKV